MPWSDQKNRRYIHVLQLICLFWLICCQNWPTKWPFTVIIGPLAQIFGSKDAKHTIFDTVSPRTSQNIDHIWFICLILTFSLKIVQIFAVYGDNLVPRPKYLDPSLSNIQYLTSPDQKLFKNIYFIGSEWYTSLYMCLARAVQFPTSNSQIWVKIT